MAIHDRDHRCRKMVQYPPTMLAVRPTLCQQRVLLIRFRIRRTVIVISELGGVGKSTLARELYHHPKLRNNGQFQAFGWAPASQKLNADRVLQTVLYSLFPENDHERRRRIDQEIRGDRAHAELYKMMKGNKSLVVIDDIWTPDDWRKIEAAFPRRSATGSRVLLTTRNQDILSAAFIDETLLSNLPFYNMEFVAGCVFKERRKAHGSTPPVR